MKLSNKLSALALAGAMLGASVLPVAAQEYVGHVGGMNGGGYVQRGVVPSATPSFAERSNATGTGTTAGTSGGSDVPAVDYSGIVAEVVQNSIQVLLVCAAAGIGLSAMYGAFRWISGYLARKSAGSKA